MIRPVNTRDAAAIARIYNHYIEHTVITFDLEAKTESWAREQIEARSGRYPWLVYEMDGRVTAYAYASPWNPRKAYDPTTELSVYADVEFSGRGHAVRLYRQLLADLRADGFHSVMAGIALPNDASVRLHEAFGFHKVGHYKEVGYKLGRWIDVGYWQLLLNDPSTGSKGSE